MTNVQNASSYTAHRPSGQQILSIIAGWEPTPYPVHRALEAEAAEQIDIAERDHAARVAYARSAAR